MDYKICQAPFTLNASMKYFTHYLHDRKKNIMGALSIPNGKQQVQPTDNTGSCSSRLSSLLYCPYVTFLWVEKRTITSGLGKQVN